MSVLRLALPMDYVQARHYSSTPPNQTAHHVCLAANVLRPSALMGSAATQPAAMLVKGAPAVHLLGLALMAHAAT